MLPSYHIWETANAFQVFFINGFGTKPVFKSIEIQIKSLLFYLDGVIKRRRRTRTAGVASPTYAWKYLLVSKSQSRLSKKNSWIIVFVKAQYIAALTMPRISVLVSPQCSTCGRHIQLIFFRTKSKYTIIGSLVHVKTAADIFLLQSCFQEIFLKH